MGHSFREQLRSFLVAEDAAEYLKAGQTIGDKIMFHMFWEQLWLSTLPCNFHPLLPKNSQQAAECWRKARGLEPLLSENAAV